MAFCSVNELGLLLNLCELSITTRPCMKEFHGWIRVKSQVPLTSLNLSYPSLVSYNPLSSAIHAQEKMVGSYFLISPPGASCYFKNKAQRFHREALVFILLMLPWMKKLAHCFLTYSCYCISLTGQRVVRKSHLMKQAGGRQSKCIFLHLPPPQWTDPFC